MSKHSVKGLANIGKLVGAAVVRHAPNDPKTTERDVKQSIIDKTASSLQGRIMTDFDLRKVVSAAVREAYNAGHAAALDQNSLVEKMLDKQYKARTELTMPVTVLGIMEQIGMSELILDLDAFATASSRCRVNMDVSSENVVTFKLTHLGDDHA